MRLLFVAMVMAECVSPATPLVEDAGPEAPPVQIADAAIAAPEYDPCVWDGQGEGVCYADTGAVFDGTACRTVCGARPSLGRSGVFASEAICNATCACRPEKFVAGGAAIQPGGYCDEVFAVFGTDAGVPAQCGQVVQFTGGEQSCRFGADPNLDRRAMSKICRMSALPEVSAVYCVLYLP